MGELSIAKLPPNYSLSARHSTPSMYYQTHMDCKLHGEPVNWTVSFAVVKHCSAILCIHQFVKWMVLSLAALELDIWVLRRSCASFVNINRMHLCLVVQNVLMACKQQLLIPKIAQAAKLQLRRMVAAIT